MTDIAAVVFDMYGTLTPNWPQTYWDEQKRGSAAGIGIPAEEWIAALDRSWHERISGLFGGLFETYRTVAGLAGHSPTDEQVTLAVEQRCATYRVSQRLREDALETLRVLRAAGLKTALVSDCTGELPAIWDATPLAELFDTTVFSCVEGTRKPDPELFRAAAHRLGVQPGQCLYVGDGGGDELHGSAAVGMLPVLPAAPDWVGSHTRGRRADAWTGLRAEALSEIPALLETVRG